MLHRTLASLLAVSRPTPRHRVARRGALVDRRGVDPESDHAYRCRWLLAEGCPRLPSPLRGAGVDARRHRPDRQRRRQALAPARLGRHAHTDPDRYGDLDRHQSRCFPRRQDRLPLPPDRSGKSPPLAASRCASRQPRGTGSTPGRPTANRSPSRPTGGRGSTSSRSSPTAVPSAGSRPALVPTTPPSIRPTALDLLPLGPRRHSRHLANSRLRRRPGRHQGRADHQRRSRRCCPPPLARRQVAVLPFLPGSHQLQRHRPRPPDPPPPARRLRSAPAKPNDIARLVGGHGTLGARPFSPDGRRFAYASFEPPPPTIRIILFTPSDRTPPRASPIASRKSPTRPSDSSSVR